MKNLLFYDIISWVELAVIDSNQPQLQKDELDYLIKLINQQRKNK